LIILQELIKEDGHFIISVPNIAHGSIKLKLLKNKFEYTEQGLLDDSHIRFFSLDNIVNLMTKTNLEISTMKRVFVDIEASEQNAALLDIPFWVKEYVYKDFESYTYQFIINAKPAKTKESCKKNNSNFLVVSEEEKRKLNLFLKSVRKPLIRRFLRQIEKLIKFILVKIKLIKTKDVL